KMRCKEKRSAAVVRIHRLPTRSSSEASHLIMIIFFPSCQFINTEKRLTILMDSGSKNIK
ncbi:hypothetical protein S245_034124, partial [Arachis hypogaea]